MSYFIRAQVWDTYGGDLELFALQLFDASGRVDADAAITSSHPPLSGSLADLQASTSATACRFAAIDVRSPGFYLQWELPSEVAITQIRLGGLERNRFARRLTLVAATAQASVLQTFADIGYPGDAILSGPVLNGDPSYGAVSLLLRPVPGNLAEIEDVSPLHRAVTPLGGVVGSMEAPLFGQAMMYFNGTGARLQLASYTHPNLNGTFTYEFWLHPSSVPSAETVIFSVDTVGGFSLLIRNQRLLVVARGVGQLYASDAGPVLQAGVRKYVQVTRSADGTITFAADGVAFATYSGVIDLFFAGPAVLDVGSVSAWTPGMHFHGLMAVRCTNGATREMGVPSGPFSEMGPQGLVPRAGDCMAWKVVSSPGGACVPQGLQSVSSSRAENMWDTEFGGKGVIYGSVARQGTPANMPLKRRVRLHRSKDGYLARETWSKADGSYEFREISTKYEWDVIAWDHELQEYSTVANNQLAEVA
ncbi:LamG domain-containing protein [Comamonas thiooxydans]|uniref:LamG domain-containing protein n=1 Tax=Comamonas thiooxydans TaxID=363952 RepID=UPI002115866F|nr:LamG domain-containing protein [Comamonas thiooxydans]UUE96183.1 LamG domain-containing protein [Comamonas thiooxydans]